MLYDIQAKTTQVVLSSKICNIINARLSPENQKNSFVKHSDTSCEVGVYELLTQITTTIAKCLSRFPFLTKANWRPQGDKVVYSSLGKDKKHISINETVLTSPTPLTTEIISAARSGFYYAFPDYYGGNEQVLFANRLLTNLVIKLS